MSNQPKSYWTKESRHDKFSQHHLSNALKEIERMERKIAELKDELYVDVRIAELKGELGKHAK